MPKQDSLCLRCRSHMCFRYHALDTRGQPTATQLTIGTVSSCKKGLYKQEVADESYPNVLSCSEFSNIFPGVSIEICPTKIKGGMDDFYVQATGKIENELYSSFEDTMEAAAELLKKELIRWKEINDEESH